MHRHGVLGGRCARSSKNETAGSQENRKAGTATTLGATATGHGKLTLRIHANPPPDDIMTSTRRVLFRVVAIMDIIATAMYIEEPDAFLLCVRGR
jgi:hypothetical protein